MNKPAAQLWQGRTVHARETPFHRAFSYPVAMVEVDVDRIDDAGTTARLFSVNRFNAIAFHAADHGERRKGAVLRAWAEERFAAASIDISGAKIHLISFPRVTGFGFAPISVWFAWNADGSPCGVIYEVHNTFGDAHAYVAAVDAEQTVMTADKEFYVSPLFDVSGAYRFTLRKTADRMDLIVENIGKEGREHVASLLVRARPMTDAAILKWLGRMPFSGLGVVFAIHWQALRLWLKGARFHAKPAHSANRTTVVGPAAEPAVALERPRKLA